MGSLKENIAQETAINCIYGPMLIVSCPGSGKTTTMVRRIRRMVEQGIRPANIIMVTFSKDAADDMKKRYVNMYGENPGVAFMTIHSLCRNILYLEKRISDAKPILGPEMRSIIQGLLENVNGVGNAYDMAEGVVSDLGRCRAYDTPVGEYEPKNCSKGLFAKIAQQYSEEKKKAGRIDFDDMLHMCRELFREDPKALARWQARYRFIQVDEYQDTSRIQRDIIYMLARENRNLCVVGDDDQSIYRFRGADNSIMMGFEEDFREYGVRKIMMGTNYRSAQKVVDMGESCIVHNRKRFEKKFISDRGRDGEKGTAVYRAFRNPSAEMEHFISVIRKKHDAGIPYDDMAILCRTNRMAETPARMLADAGIPFYSKEKLSSMYDKWMFQDIRAYIELSMGKNERTNMLRILNRPNRYVTANTFRDVEFDTAQMIAALEYKKGDKKGTWVYDTAVDSFNAWLSGFGPGKVTEDTPTADLVKRLSGKGTIQYDRYVQQVARTRRMNEDELKEEFEALKNDALRFRTVGQWLAYADRVSEWIRKKNQEKDKSGVRISTMHGSKGLEWKIVFISGVNENVIPGKNTDTMDDIEEERRVLYVAMTRAKDELYIGSSSEPSRFIAETEGTLQEKYRPVVQKKLAGAPVMHKTYGEGTVVGYKQERIAVRFGSTVRKFVFPDEFTNGYMKYL